jgi:hypothetical protein
MSSAINTFSGPCTGQRFSKKTLPSSKTIFPSARRKHVEQIEIAVS